MRQIDNMTPQELDTLALKGMTAPRTASERPHPCSDEANAPQWPNLDQQREQSNKAQPRKADAASHSPLPWQIAEYGIRELKAKYLCIKHDNRTIARIDAHGNSLSVTPTDEANARLIVASVNHAEKLAELLQRIAKVSPKLTMPVEGVTFADTMLITEVKQALAAYEAAQ